MSNLRIWSALQKTDPAHTKSFSRSGGFKGTAVRPVYCEQRMTEQFGPCGVGWGMSEPQFQLVNGPDEQVLVYCWLSIWYVDGDKKSEPVWGVGGDTAVAKNKYGVAVDDEALKKAFTDAIGNAMKHLGMSADIHMGQYDDSKYVNSLRQEFANGNGQATGQKPPATQGQQGPAAGHANGQQANGVPQGGVEEAGRIRVEYPGKPALIPVPAPVEGDDMTPVWAVWGKAFKKAIAQSRSQAGYDAWLELNKHPLDNLSKHNADWHRALIAWAKENVGKKFEQTPLSAG